MCLNSCNNDTGVLVLDHQSGPKWRLSCNKCPAVVGLFEGAQKLKVLDKRCAACGALHVTATYTVSYFNIFFNFAGPKYITLYCLGGQNKASK